MYYIINHNDKQYNQGTKLTKQPKFRQKIESNRTIITEKLYDAASVKRLNNINWLRHEISYSEPRTLFQVPLKEQNLYLDFNCMNNLGAAYDFIVNNKNLNKRIDVIDICKLHSVLCQNTYINGGNFRTTTKVLEITVNGKRMHAPDAYDIPYLINEIVYKINNTSTDILHRAFDAHYELIALQPFDDFNKRTARLVMNWILVQNGYRPIVFNKPSDKQKYKEAIKTYAEGNKKEYYAYMSQCMLRTQQDIIKLLTKSKML